MSPYANQIAELTKQPPRLIEAWIRSEHGTLDRLSQSQFAAEVRIAEECIAQAGIGFSERLARSFGLEAA